MGNLTNGASYQFRVRAVNTQGNDGIGPASNVATATPLEGPGAPTGGGAVTRYEYRQRSGS